MKSCISESAQAEQTTIDNDAERRVFEAWLGHEDTDRDVFNDYANGVTQMQWRAWKERARMAQRQLLAMLEQ